MGDQSHSDCSPPALQAVGSRTKKGGGHEPWPPLVPICTGARAGAFSSGISGSSPMVAGAAPPSSEAVNRKRPPEEAADRDVAKIPGKIFVLPRPEQENKPEHVLAAAGMDFSGTNQQIDLGGGAGGGGGGLGSSVSDCENLGNLRSIAPDFDASTHLALASGATGATADDTNHTEATQDEAMQSNEENTSQVPTGKPPQLYIYNVRNKSDAMSKLISSVAGYDVYGRKVADMVVYRLNQYKEYNDVVNALSTRNIEYHTYGPKGLRPLKVTIRGLDKDTDINEIMSGLKALNFSMDKVWRLGTSSLFVAVLRPGLNNKRIYNERYLCGLCVKFQAYKEPDRPRQCHRCQRFGHSSMYCTAQTRCVKCAGNHLSVECKKEKGTPATCANCADAHPANYKGCEAFKNAVEASKPKLTSDSAAAREVVKQIRTFDKPPEKNPWRVPKKVNKTSNVTEKSDNIASTSTELLDEPEELAVALETDMEVEPAAKQAPKKKKVKSVKGKIKTKPKKTIQSTNQKAVKAQPAKLIVQLPPETAKKRKISDKKSAENVSFVVDKDCSASSHEAAKAPKSTVSDDFKEVMTFFRSINLKATLRMVKYHLARLASAKDVFTMIEYLFEALTSIDKHING